MATKTKQDCFSDEGRRPANVCIYLHLFDLSCCCDLDLDIRSECDLLFLHTENEVCRSRQPKVRARTGIQTRFCSFDLDLDPTTLMYELDLDIVKVYLHIKDYFRSWL